MPVTKHTISAHSALVASDDPAWRKPVHIPLDRNGPILVAYDPPAADFIERSVFDLFEQIALAKPDADALADGNTTLTYAEVRSQVRRLACAIEAQVPAGKAVAVLLPNAPPSVIAMLACLAAGRCCLVLNADHPTERNAGILRDAGVYAAVIRNEDCAEASILPDGAMRIDFSATVAAEARWTRTASLGPDDPAIVLYTSGSTGQPKGIVLSQATILTRVRNNIIAMHLRRADCFLSLGALGTTAGLVASMVALLGGSLQLVVSVSATGASSLLSLIRDHHVTILWGVPALLRLLFENSKAAEALASLRVVRTFGDRLLNTECAAWRAVLPDTCHLAITYGQTESTIAQWYVPRDFSGDVAAVPTGYLLPEHEYAVLEEDGTAAADGQVGELVLRGRCVALGEWEHGGVVSGRLRPDPFDPRRRILPTGDLVRLRPDGLLQIIGRVDRQVKINGQRVEPAEIEDALRRVPGVANAAIAARRNGEETSLLAFIVAGEPSDTALLDRARSAIRISLPNYMQPARILLVESLPLLPGGKIDDQALLKIEAATAREQRSFAPAPAASTEKAAPPRATADAERAVTVAWRRVLGLMPAPGVKFLEVAGNSLRLLELVFALESLTGRRLPLDAFSAEASAAQMALALDAALRNPTPPPANQRVFLLPGARGDTPGLAGLRADCLPVAAMQMVTYPDWREMLRAGLTLEGIAEAVVAQVHAISPAGPICLVGYSFGVDVAFAVCRMLEGEGREVARLVLIDMPPPPQRSKETHGLSPPTTTREVWWAVDRLRRVAREIWWTADRLRRAAREGMAAERLGMIAAPFAMSVMRRLGGRTLAASRITKGWSRHFGDLGYWTSHHMGQELRLQAAHEWTLRWCAPAARLRAPLLLIRTAAHRQDGPEDLGWSEFAERVQVTHVQGTHVSMLSAAHRRAVSDAVGAALASALSAPSESAERMPH
jgi:amino acid adenylation domain-containing protein